jgi:hypothetical protein
MPHVAKLTIALAFLAAPVVVQAQDARHDAVDAVEAPITAELNSRVTSDLYGTQARNAQAEAEYDARMRQYEQADDASSQAQARYSYQQRAYALAMSDWRAQVAACRDGYTRACDAPSPDPADY